MAPLAIDEVAPTTQECLLSLNGHADNKRTNGMNVPEKPACISSMVPEEIAPVPSSTTTCSLADLQTEQENANTTNVDAMSSLDLCRKRPFPSNPVTLRC